MGLNFRKRIKIAPGLTVNLGKKGVSLTAGRRGASINVGPRGTHANIGIPGTGISYRARLDTPNKSRSKRIQIQSTQGQGNSSTSGMVFAWTVVFGLMGGLMGGFVGLLVLGLVGGFVSWVFVSAIAKMQSKLQSDKITPPTSQACVSDKDNNKKLDQDRHLDFIGRLEVRDLVVREVSAILPQAEYDTSTKKIEVPMEQVYDNVKEATDSLGLSEEQIKEAVKQSIPVIIKNETDNGLLSKETEHVIATILMHYGILLNDLHQTTRIQIGKGKTLRNLFEGNVESCFNASNFPFNFQKSETVIWGWGGMSVSILKTTRAGALGKQRVINTGLVSLGTLPVVITSRHLYYGGKRVHLDKIVSIDPYSDGVLISLETGKPLCFFADDPGFFVNVLQNVQNWA